MKILEPFFKPQPRTTPTWEQLVPVDTINRDLVIKVITGQLPIGLLPFEIITEAERVKISKELFNLPWRKYNDTGDEEDIRVLGTPFVDSKTLTEHLQNCPPYYEDFQKIIHVIRTRLFRTFEIFGFDVKPLVDPLTGLTYPDFVARLITVPKDCNKKKTGNPCTVLHCDDFYRDGLQKADFRLPEGLNGKNLHQFSVCIQLEDGGFPPDKLFVHMDQYSIEKEEGFNDPELPWLYDASKLSSDLFVAHTPILRQSYFFSTLNFHDVRDGHPLSKRLNLSVFFIYDFATNTLYPYN